MSDPSRDGFDRQLTAYRNSALERLRRKARETMPAGRKWAQFAAAGAAALSSATSAEAEIIHVVPSEPVTVDVDNNELTGIDVDGDSHVDLVLGAAKQSYGTTFRPVKLRYGILYGYDGALVPSAYPFFGYYDYFAVRQYAPGETVSPFNANPGSFIRTSQTGTSYTFHGLWGKSETGYAAFALNFGQSSAQAGWVKVRTRRAGSGLDKVDVLEWAYESTPNMPIKAGATSDAGSVAGDYDGNGAVGPEDYDEWKSQFGQSVDPPGSGADGDHDGQIGAGDYTAWRDNLSGTSASGASQANIPEPGAMTLGMLALGAAGIAALRRPAR